MKIKSVWWVAILVAVLATPLFAGDYKCTADAQTCLNHMAAKYKQRGWVGIEMDESEAGILTVERVLPESPAAAAGFQVGDQLAAFQGQRFGEAEEEAMKKAYEGMVPGSQVTYTVVRDGSERDLNVTLGSWPDEVLAAMIGRHMVDQHVTIAQAQN